MVSCSRLVVPAFAALIVSATALHAGMVLVANLPSSELKRDLAPLYHRYGGPYVWQGWSLFAPDVADANLRVLVRGRSVDGAVTPWYDASLYFIDRNAANDLGVDRVSEGLFHGAQAIVFRQDATSRSEQLVIVERTSAMVLRAYAGRRPTQMQIQIDERDIPAIGATKKETKAEIALTIPWRRIPNVAELN